MSVQSRLGLARALHAVVQYSFIQNIWVGGWVGVKRVYTFVGQGV